MKLQKNWQYGKNMLMRNETIHFIQFSIDTIKKTVLFQKMYSNNIPKEKSHAVSKISNFLKKIIEWARKTPDIEGIVLVGSYA